VVAEHVAFAVWSLWSVLALFMVPERGFTVSAGDKFLLTSVATLAGAALRVPYSLAVTRLGGRNFTVLSGLGMLVPVGLAAELMRHPHAPFGAFLACAAVSGLGGGSFASSMTNINAFFPEREKGRALGLNAGGGNLGVASVQLLGLLVAAVSGTADPWVLPAVLSGCLLVSAAAAGRAMDNLAAPRGGPSAYRAVLGDRRCWALCALYMGTFGSFIGFSFAFGLVLQDDFGRSPLQAAALTFTGPLLGSLARPVGGMLADRYDAARVTTAAFLGLAAGTAVVLAASVAGSLPLFTAGFEVLFVLSGLGNGSTYKLIPATYAAWAARRTAAGTPAGEAAAEGLRRTGAVIAVAGAVGGLGGVAINLAFRESYAHVHDPRPALLGFLVCYGLCVAVTRTVRAGDGAGARTPAPPGAAGAPRQLPDRPPATRTVGTAGAARSAGAPGAPGAASTAGTAGPAGSAGPARTLARRSSAS
jgi:NNP family nitrate/nitrite transporter-like MFS transporter